MDLGHLTMVVVVAVAPVELVEMDHPLLVDLVVLEFNFLPHLEIQYLNRDLEQHQ